MSRDLSVSNYNKSVSNDVHAEKESILKGLTLKRLILDFVCEKHV